MLVFSTVLVLGAMAAPVESSTAKLVLTIEADKEAIVLYEPLTVRSRVKNPTTESIKSNVYMGGIEFFITRLDEGTNPYHTSSIEDSILLEITHKPGAVLVSEKDLGWNAGAFPAAGRYEVRARLYAGRRPTPVHLESNSLRIEVKQPSGVDSAAIASFPSEAEFKRLIQQGVTAYCEGRNGPACFEELRQFVDRYGSSAYAPTVTWYLASAVESGRLDVQPQHEIAVRLYKTFLERWPGHANAPRVMYGLAMTLDQAGRTGEAGEVILAFEKRFPDHTEMATSLRTNFAAGQMLPPKQ